MTIPSDSWKGSIFAEVIDDFLLDDDANELTIVKRMGEA